MQEKMYLYQEYDDDMPFGEALFKLFASEEAAKAHLAERVKKCEEMSLSELAQVIDNDDTVTDTYVSVRGGRGGTRYYCVEEMELDNAVVIQDEISKETIKKAYKNGTIRLQRTRWRTQ